MKYEEVSDRISAFTLAETLITLVIVGVIAALTVPSLIAKYHEEQTVSRVEKMYSIITQLVYQYQLENSCLGNISNCFEAGERHDNDKFYKKFEKGLNVVHKLYPNQDISSINWLPTNCTAMNGEQCAKEHGIWKSDSTNWQMAYYGLGDGSILAMIVPDTYGKSGIIFIDTNGKKGPNRVGKDQYPIGIGSYANSLYKSKVHPYFNEDDNRTYGNLCNINNSQCDPDVCTKSSCSPTAYLLKHKKLPPITW